MTEMMPADKSVAILVMIGSGCLALIFLVALVAKLINDSISSRADKNRKERLAAIPNELTAAMEEARKAAEHCLGMCQAMAFVKSLKSRAGRSRPAQKPKGFRGPDEAELLCKTRMAASWCLKRCWSLSVEALQLTPDRRYYALRGIFEAAESACESCSPNCKLKACPALEFIENVSVET